MRIENLKECKCLHCRKTFYKKYKSSIQKFCSHKCADTYNGKNRRGKNNPASRSEVKKKISIAHKNKYKNGYVNPLKNKKRSDLSEYNKKYKCLCTKEKNSNWRGGKSMEKYGEKFNDELKIKIKNRDNNMCQICECKERLHIHHVDYKKKNNIENNLITLCISCHMKTNFHRNKWEQYFIKYWCDIFSKKYRVSIHICTKDRHTELALLLQSLRTQYFKNWDLVILDESQTSILNNNFLPHLLNIIKMEGHHVNIIKNELSLGVCNARNKLIEEDYFDDCNLKLRVDDDVILEQDYIYKLLMVIDAGYDIASGVTPNANQPIMERDVKHVKPIINKKLVDEKGELITYGDDCGYGYMTEDIIPAHEFRSNAIMKREVVEKIRYPSNLSPVGFREEGFFSTLALIEGFKIGVNTKAIAYHLRTPFGGCRFPDYTEKVISDDAYYKKWLKEKIEKKGNPFEV